MSAIAGVWTWGSRPAPEASCRRMLDAQQAYGPDRQGLWTGGDAALGHRLYRLLREDESDRQPPIGGGGRFALVADLRLAPLPGRLVGPASPHASRRDS
jgi:asparagine synthase (glutamine-hydrolysing)